MNGMFGVKIQSSRWDFCFILFAPGDESPGYCHRCPLMGHQNRFKLALMPEGGGMDGGGPFSFFFYAPLRITHPFFSFQQLTCRAGRAGRGQCGERTGVRVSSERGDDSEKRSKNYRQFLE